ncbi:RAB7A-interacting MON1-CCZ1 complex subunit 1-like [Ornithodoros turicata]|uniref:RAB7A-interacting MON1-CCZ1 complex subunit 1-like n=1 Tax=Ornithodoros turicata TaxID=34597 RepID=UPI003139A924
METAAKVISNEVDDLLKIIEELKLKTVVPTLLESSLSKLLALKNQLKDDEFLKQSSNKDALQQLMKIVLDVTYCRENRLADNDFSESDSLERVNAIIRSLEHVENITKHMGFQTVVEGLGEELAECLEWRKGALLYMFCQTKESDDENWVDQNKETFLKLLQRGVEHLTAVLNVRHSIKADETTVLSGSEDVIQLLEKGIFSDVHALALMYAGEMCYWLVSYTDKWDLPATDSVAKALPLGIQVLGTYTEAVEGPLKDAGWNCARAKELRDSLLQRQKL